MQLPTVLGTIVEYAVGRQVEDEAADHYGHATARMAWMPPRFQPDGLVASKVAPYDPNNASVPEIVLGWRPILM